MKMAVDASAVLAILFDEPDAELYFSKLLTATTAMISPVNWWEVQANMLKAHGKAGEARSAKWMEDFGMRIEPITAIQARVAVEAFARYRGRPARLNMGDCFAYALAQAKGVPLLYKSKDFEGTDVAVA